jgi:hypothetical protein
VLALSLFAASDHPWMLLIVCLALDLLLGFRLFLQLCRGNFLWCACGITVGSRW